MASGKTHNRRTRNLALFCFLSSFIISARYIDYLSTILLSSCIFVGCMIGTIISPDMDVDVTHIGRSLVRKRHPILGFFFYWYWWPYAKIMPHRSWHSHAPIFSTFIRVGYVLWPILFFPNIWPYIFNVWAGMILLGLMLSDTLHWWDDGRPRWRR